MQCLERRKAQEKEGPHPRFSCSIHVECTSCLAKSSVPTSTVQSTYLLGCEVTYVHHGLRLRLSTVLYCTCRPLANDCVGGHHMTYRLTD